jgi:hypothetical protein
VLLGAQRAQLREAEDGLQRRAQLVADVGDELRLGARGLLGQIAGLADVPLGIAELGDVGQGGQDAGGMAVTGGHQDAGDDHVALGPLRIRDAGLVADALARAQHLLALLLVQRQLGRAEQADRAASDHLLAAQAAEGLPGLVDGDVAVLLIHQRDGQGADLQQQGAEVALGAQPLLDLDALGHIHRRARVAGDLRARIPGHHRHIEVAHGAVLALHPEAALATGRAHAGIQQRGEVAPAGGRHQIQQGRPRARRAGSPTTVSQRSFR